MSTRLLAMLTAGMVVLVGGCGGGDQESPAASSGPTSDAQPSSMVSQPTYTKFDDWPGEELQYTRAGENLGARVKPVDAEWTPELAGKPADAGQQFLAVYVTVTGELADRGTENVNLDSLELRFKPTAGECTWKTLPVDGEDYCFASANPRSQLENVADHEWRNTSWTPMSVMGTNISRGETLFGVVGFSLPDAVDAAAFELCGPSKSVSTTSNAYPCVPVKTPEKPRS